MRFKEIIFKDFYSFVFTLFWQSILLLYIHIPGAMDYQ